MALTRSDIAALIPHAGAMCLLDGVVRWDATHISCIARSHRDVDNPLRAGGRLDALCGIEYAAQAMAVHGGLAGSVGARPKAGYLVSLRDVICRESRLDNLHGDLVVDAERLMGDEGRVIYQFALRVGAAAIMSGRATVVLDAAAVSAPGRAA
ncbi:MAG: hydroxymyristoyl-ACP dehydratase [Burkholderiales bacterium]